MLAELKGRQKAFIFYGITFTLAVIVCLAVPVIGEASLIITMMTPAVAVVIMLLVVTGEGRSRSAWTDLGIGRAGFGGWPFAILAPALILTVSYAIIWTSGIGAFQLPELSRSVPATIVKIALGLIIGTTFAFCEEIGWRGYMLPHLSKRATISAMLTVGFLHGLWHLPLMLTTPYYHSVGNPLIVVPLFLTTLTLAGILYGYLRIATASVWPVAIAHAVHNSLWELFSETTQGDAVTLEYVGGESGILEIAGLAVVAAIVIRLMRKREMFPAPQAA